MKAYRILLQNLYTAHVTNAEVRDRIHTNWENGRTRQLGLDIFTGISTVIIKSFKTHRHSGTLCYVDLKRKQGDLGKIGLRKWAKMGSVEVGRAAEDRQKWMDIVKVA